MLNNLLKVVREKGLVYAAYKMKFRDTATLRAWFQRGSIPLKHSEKVSKFLKKELK